MRGLNLHKVSNTTRELQARKNIFSPKPPYKAVLDSFHMVMVDSVSLDALRGLHQDLLALSEARLLNIERLWIQLESRVEEFRQLLNKRPKSEQSRQTVLSG